MIILGNKAISTGLLLFGTLRDRSKRILHIMPTLMQWLFVSRRSQQRFTHGVHIKSHHAIATMANHKCISQIISKYCRVGASRIARREHRYDRLLSTRFDKFVANSPRYECATWCATSAFKFQPSIRHDFTPSCT